MASPKMKKENERHFDMESAGGGYRIAKTGLSDEMLNRIRGYAQGGEVDPNALPERKGNEVGVVIGPDGKPVLVSTGEPVIQPRRFQIDAGPPAMDVAGYVTDEFGNRRPVPQSEIDAGDSGRAETYARMTAAQQPQIPPVPGFMDRLAAAARGGHGVNPQNAMDVESALITNPSAIPRADLRKEWVDHDEAIDQRRMKEAADRKRLGIVPPGEGQPAPTASTMPSAAPAQAQRRVGFSPYRADMGATNAAADAQRAAIGANAEVAADLGRQQARTLDAQHQEMERIEGERRARIDRAMQETQRAQAGHQAALDEMKNISTTVDPGRYWASRSTGQRILGIAGLVLGALGAGKDGINHAAGMLQQAIDRDVEAQKVELSARLQKGRASVEGAQSMYAQAREHFQDEGAAMAATKAAAYEMSKLKFEQLVASSAGPAAKAQAQMAIAGINAKVADLKNEAAEKEAKSRIEAGLAGAQATHLYAQSAGAGGVPKDAAKTLTEVEERARNIEMSGERLLGLIDKVGTGELVGPEEDQMRQLATDMAVDAAKLKDPNSVARPGEVELELKGLFQPGWMQMKDTAKGKIRSFLDNSERRRVEAFGVRGMEAPPRAAKAKK